LPQAMQERDGTFFAPSPEWRSLFDGKSLSQWRFLHDQEIDPRFWTIEDGVIRTLPGGQWGADIITRDTFSDFAFCAEWKVALHGNSGILYNVKEDQWRGQDQLPARVRNAWLTMGGITLLAAALFFVRRGFLKHEMVRALILGMYVAWLAHTIQPFERLLAYAHYMENWKSAGFEMQIYDDASAGASSIEPAHANGALYDIFAPTSVETRPTGSWNESCIVIDGKQVEHWVNGAKVLGYQLESSDLERETARSRYRVIQGLTKKSATRVALQNHDGQLTWFRNLRIRALR